MPPKTPAESANSIDDHDVEGADTHGFLGAPRSRKYADGMRELRAWLAQHD
jgi:hypothetical protein